MHIHHEIRICANLPVFQIDNFYLEQFPINFTIQIGLGASQLDDLRILAPPVENSVRQEFGAWSGNWIVEMPQNSDRIRLLSTP